jgi:glycosyltransferase involved in cell wall biosynthesis
MNTPRIGIDARLLAYRKGGIAEYTRQLIRALADLDTRSDYAIIHRFSDRETWCPAANFRRVNALTPAHHKYERTVLSLELFPRRLNLLHSPDFIPPWRAAHHHIITIHDLHFLHYPQFQTPDSLRYYRDHIRWAVEHADHIFAQTEGTRREIVEMLGVSEEKITVHLLGVNPAFQPMAVETTRAMLAAYQLPEQYILFVGTIEPRKNIPGLLKAYALLRQKHAGVPPLVLGGQRGWNATESLAAIETLHLREAVIWFQDVPVAVLPALYNRALFLVLPSFTEGFGMPAVEAMACGTPVVVAQRGSLPEVVGNCGVYIEPEDIESIAEGMWHLLTDTALVEQLRRDGLARAKTFTWKQTAEIALQVYRRVLSS